MSTTLHIDLDEGRFVEIGCLGCRETTLATLSMAAPVRMYAVSLDCDECLEPLVTFDLFSHQVSPDAILSASVSNPTTNREPRSCELTWSAPAPHAGRTSERMDQ